MILIKAPARVKVRRIDRAGSTGMEPLASLATAMETTDEQHVRRLKEE